MLAVAAIGFTFQRPASRQHEQQVAAPGARARRRPGQGVPREYRDPGEDEPGPEKLHRARTLAQHEEAEQHRHHRNEARRDDGVVQRRRERGGADQDERVGRAGKGGQHQRPPPAGFADEDRPHAEREAQDRDVGGAQAVEHRPARHHRLHAPDQRAEDAEAEPLPEGAPGSAGRDRVNQARLPMRDAGSAENLKALGRDRGRNPWPVARVARDRRLCGCGRS